MMLAALTFTIASATFKPHTTMPLSTVYSQCGGQNVSPELHWSGAPNGTKSFALIMHDPDAPHPGGWYHWIVMGLQPFAHSLTAGVDMPPAVTGVNSFGAHGYGGPCPPPGKPHHYNFTLYALDMMPSLEKDVTGPQLEQAIKGHVLAKTTLTGLYQTH